ncbi:MAG: hypothetical protein ACREBU_02560 [Nitrososphaera sp.]
MQRKVAVGIAIPFGIAAIIAGLFAYAYSQVHVRLTEISFAGIDLAPASLRTLGSFTLNALSGNALGSVLALVDGVRFNFLFDAANGGIFPVAIPSVSYDLSINGVNVGKGEGHFDTVLNPGETKTLPVQQSIQKGNIQIAAASIVAEGGVMTIKASGTAQFGLFGLVMPVPFESTKQISIIDEIKKRVGSSRPESATTFLTIRSSSQSVTTGDTVTFDGRLTDGNNNGLANFQVYIRDEDLGSGDDLIGAASTDSSGFYNLRWTARSMDPFDNVVEVYAVFEGSTPYGEARSAQINVQVG